MNRECGRELIQAFDRCLQRVGLDIGQHHFHAGLRKGSPERKADAAGAAGHECCFAGEIAHGSFSLDPVHPYLHDAARTDSEFR